MSLADEVRALRSSAGLSAAYPAVVVEVDGPGALELLQLASTQSPYLREGRVRHTLLLREDGSVLADALVTRAGARFLVVAEGPTEAELVSWLSDLRPTDPDKAATVRGCGDAWALLGVDGPYAWELIGGLLGPGAVGMPYLSLLPRDEILCIRAGKTGEYGYLLLVPRGSAASVEARIVELGAALDLARVGVEALDVCALESWHFSLRALHAPERVGTLTPLELQLQWRVGQGRTFLGAEALRARRAAGLAARLTCFVADGGVVPGARVALGELDLGEVVAVCDSPTLGGQVGAALLAKPFAHPHLACAAIAPRAVAQLRTCTAFLVDNRSLHVQPHKGHTYATRAERP